VIWNSLVKRQGFSLELGRIFGVPLKLHFGMALLLLMIVVHCLINDTLLILGVVVLSSILHELAHAVVAGRYNVAVRDLWLSPIGGHLRFEKMPKDWNKELSIALAGPVLNLILAGLFFGLHFLLGRSAVEDPGFWHSLPKTIAWVNLIFALFNLLPGFPLDGGRVVRAWLARSKSRVDATRAPALAGRWIAAGLLVSAVLPQIPVLLALAAAGYVFVLSEFEWRTVKAQAARGESDFDPPQDDGFVVGPAPYGEK